MPDSNLSPNTRKDRAGGGDITPSSKEAAPEVDLTVPDVVHQHGTEGWDNSLPDTDPYAYNSNQDSFDSKGGPA